MSALASGQEGASLTLSPRKDLAEPSGVLQTSTWIYALVAPFPTVTDDVTASDLLASWNGKPSGPFSGRPLLVAPSTLAAFTAIWGQPASGAVQVLSAGELLDTAWNTMPAWALIPFEDIQPRWKVLSVDGQSPLHKDFNSDQYPLKVQFDLHGNPAAWQELQATAGIGSALIPASNRDPGKLTTLIMTGTTALVRATAAMMDRRGVDFPGQDIAPWMRAADLVHISNEIPFYTDCPPADPMQAGLRFCTPPRDVKLLQDIGANIIELTGNHLNDYGIDALRYTIDMYRQLGWPTFGGGMNLQEARQPLLIENHGNKLAFLGCNSVGPSQAWATQNGPGAAPCDYAAMHAEIQSLRAQGYLPIVTFQYNEYYTMRPSDSQQRDFRGMADAGAVIVSGSQAHFPQGMGFDGEAFIHYGPGNLFFDQMDYPVVGTRREFLDRHVFYDGHYLGVELLTAMLEDYARPRPMTSAERQSLLQDAFQASDWAH